ncbi:MAG: FHA domain-containing protein [Polaromonas sp. 39-63-203]|jgi:pSer/pThr/pTyr-binding forkhead associated (FHA) protein|uniref:FHA domain-containing protein n=1 Tax=Polaromonas sp. TaxID=1869339 RepID=UPI000BCD2A59|nr:FHA domain-containing protein [Polaromonas sp.]OYY53372.1 MAG: FHA domain-containing protein [Polaromonas sp. 35-63-240]OYZ03211.1 MAG: FHA domain-containing protein [Polaromonas sp. 28-63-22]OYZ84708.1 MAG: FHA domain-containing protein [Polaromonas sp. 24-62-144]OZA99305.1 MAG: FHA domain-containing protein [Polaromonas sp. 39-63-203]HQS30566.1 FHA domain-containing protein [Polaromonas sp.]
MPKMIVSIDGVVIREVQVTKDRTSVGRRPYNDVVIDNLAVSGEHAVLQMSGNEVYLEDLNSTNGTFVNGKAVKKHLLNDSDTVEIGKYKIKYVHESSGAADKGLMNLSPRAELSDPVVNAPAGGVPPLPEAGTGGSAAIKVLSGAAAGREVALVKVVTTIGKPGVAVAAITKRPQGFVVVHVEGGSKPTLNGTPMGTEPVLLVHGDVLELAGTKMQFVQQ